MVNLIHQFGSSFFHDRTSYLTSAVSRMVHNINNYYYLLYCTWSCMDPLVSLKSADCVQLKFELTLN